MNRRWQLSLVSDGSEPFDCQPVPVCVPDQSGCKSGDWQNQQTGESLGANGGFEPMTITNGLVIDMLTVGKMRVEQTDR